MSDREGDRPNVIFHHTGIDCDVKSSSVRQIEMESLTGRSSSIHLSTFVRRMYMRERERERERERDI